MSPSGGLSWSATWHRHPGCRIRPRTIYGCGVLGEQTGVRPQTAARRRSEGGDPSRRGRFRPAGAGTLGRLASSPVALAALGVVVSGVFALVHLVVAAKGDISAFILVGAGHAVPAQLPPGITVYHEGYDGQFYYRLAVDPLQWRHSALGVTFDSAYRIVRIAYPALAWLLAAGQRDVVPVTLIVVNVLAFGVLAGCACALARDAGRHPAWGLLIPAYWGYLWTISRDLTELVAAAALVGTLLAIRRDRQLVAALCLSVGVLGRETAMVLVAAIFLARMVGWARGATGRTIEPPDRTLGDLANGGPGFADLVWLLPAVTFAGWELAVYERIGVFPVSASASTNRGLPFAGIVHGIGHYLPLLPHGSAVEWLVELLVLTFVVLGALVSFPNTRALVHERLAWIGFLVLSISLSDDIWQGDVGFRSLDEVFVLSAVLLLYSPRRLRVPSLVVALTWLAVFVQLARVV